MFGEHPNHVIVTATVEFAPQIGFAARLPGIAEHALKILNANNWNVARDSIVVRGTRELRYFLLVDSRQALAQSLGWEAWKQKGEDLLDLIADAVEKMSADVAKSATIRTIFFAPVAMRHPELVELLFESYFLPRASFEDLHGKVYDASCQLYTTSDSGQKVRSGVFPMTAEQADQQFMMTPLLELASDSKFYDRGLDEFRTRLRQDCLFIEVNVTAEATPRNVLARELRQAVIEAERQIQILVDRVRSVKRAKGR